MTYFFLSYDLKKKKKNWWLYDIIKKISSLYIYIYKDQVFIIPDKNSAYSKIKLFKISTFIKVLK